MDKKEIARGSAQIVKMDLDIARITVTDPKTQKTKQFTFDSVFDTDSKQVDVYADTATSLVESVMEGYNGTMFAYGQTGCGKTFTMEGLADPPEMRGIIPSCFDQIFRMVGANTDANKSYLISTAYIEIYNEDIRDLLGQDCVAKLQMKEDPDRGVFIQGLTWTVIKDVAHMLLLMKKGNVNRTTGATLMNATSSRSHSIFMINIETSEKSADGEDHIRAGKKPPKYLQLVSSNGSSIVTELN